FQLNYVFNEPPVLPAGLTFNDLALRWPLERRVVAYATANPGAVEAEALFEWDASSGIENGEYDVYIVTCEDMGLLAAADLAQGGAYLSDFGRDGFVPAATGGANAEMRVDVEFFTDRDGDRRAWNDVANDNYPRTA